MDEQEGGERGQKSERKRERGRCGDTGQIAGGQGEGGRDRGGGSD